MQREIPIAKPSVQLDLFRVFHGKQKEEFSNLFMEWDFYPVYSVSRKQQAKLKKTNNGHLNILKKDFLLKGVLCTIEITPAILETNKGREEFFPSSREELVEHALRRLFIIQHDSIHDPFKETWVIFTIKQLQNELAKVGHGMTFSRLKESLDILRGARIKVTDGRKTTFDSNLLSTMLLTDRQEYLHDSKSQCAGQFNSLITHSIDKYRFRQMNYLLFMRCKNRISRWILKELVFNYTNAGHGAPTFKILASNLSNNCGMDYKSDRATWTKIREAIEELKSLKCPEGTNAIIQIDSIDVLGNKTKGVEEQLQKVGAKTIDIIFHVNASKYFINFMIASNSRIKEMRLSVDIKE